MHIPRPHLPRQTPDPGQQSGAAGDGWRALTIDGQRRLQHRPPVSPQGSVPMRTLQNLMTKVRYWYHWCVMDVSSVTEPSRMELAGDVLFKLVMPAPN